MLIDGIDSIESDEARRNQVDMIVAKIMRSKGRMSNQNREQFASLTGGKTPEQFAEDLRHSSVDKAVESIRNNREAFAYVKSEPMQRPQIITDVEDEVIRHERGYGRATKPEDYLREFRDFIDNNRNQIIALNIIATRPRDLTRQSLKELKLILDREDFSETKLQTAWKEMTNEDIAADIISFIRQRSIGDALIGKDERIHNAIEKLKKTHPEFTNENILRRRLSLTGNPLMRLPLRIRADIMQSTRHLTITLMPSLMK